MSTHGRVSHLTTAEMHNLDAACDLIGRAFDTHPYLVGSAGERGDFRDVDVRLILADEAFDAMFAGRLKLWELLSVAIGDYLRQRTGLPIDFQIQRQTEANAKHNKPRNPLGGLGRIYAGGGDATAWTPRTRHAVMRWLAVAVLLLAGCGTAPAVMPSSAPRTPSAVPTTVPTPFPPPPRWVPVPSAIPTIVPAPTLKHLSPAPAKTGKTPVRPPSHPDVDWLTGPGISVHVGVYHDCSGTTPIASGTVVLDECFRWPYFAGHNPGVFTPLARYSLGTRLTWWDDSGTQRTLTIIRREVIRRVSGAPPLAPGAGAQMQTCLDGDGSIDVILDASVT